MAFLDGIGKKLSQTSQDVVKKTKNFADSAKYSGMIIDEEKNIHSLYTELGKACYELYKEEPQEELRDLIGKINSAFSRIDQYNEQIALLNGAQKCPRCGVMVPDGGMFCNSCGAKLPPKASAQPAAPAEDMARCGNCGAEVPATQKFCVYCGCQVTAQTQGKTCPTCGKSMDPDAAFCPGCGSAI